MKKKLVLAMAATMAITSCAVPVLADDAAAEGGKIGISMPTQSLERWNRDGSYLEEQFKAAGYDVELTYSDNETDRQVNDIQNLISDGVNLLVIAAIDGEALNTVMDEAADAGIPVIIVDRMVDVSDDSLYTAWVGSNFKLEGQKAMAWLDAYLEAKGRGDEEINLVDIQGTIGASAQIGRTEGFDEAVEAHDNWTTLAQQSGEFTQAKGQEVMESMLKQYDNINVVYCENDNEAFGAIDAIEAAGKTVGSDIANGEIMVMSFDTTNAGLTDTLAGKIACDVECNPLHGPRAEELIKALEAGEEVEKLNYVDEEIFATDDTVDKVKAVNSLDEEGEYDVTPITQEIIDGRAY